MRSSTPGYPGNHVFTKVADNFDTYLDSLFIDLDMAEDVWADVVDSDARDPWRRTVEEWLDTELPAWRAEDPPRRIRSSARLSDARREAGVAGSGSLEPSSGSITMRLSGRWLAMRAPADRVRADKAYAGRKRRAYLRPWGIRCTLSARYEATVLVAAINEWL